MVATSLAGADVEVRSGGGEDPLPHPLAWRGRILAAEGVGKLHASALRAGGQVAFVLGADGGQMLSKRRNHRSRQDGVAVLAALAVAHQNFAALDVDILDSEVQRFEEAKTASVK